MTRFACSHYGASWGREVGQNYSRDGATLYKTFVCDACGAKRVEETKVMGNPLRPPIQHMQARPKSGGDEP